MGDLRERLVDKRPHIRHPVISGGETVPVRQRKKDRYDEKPTGVMGVSLRIEHGSNPRVSQAEVEDVLRDAVVFKEEDALAKLHEGNREKLRKKLIPKFRRHRVWRGIISQPDDLVLRADESEVNVAYDVFLLRRSMSRDVYRDVVRRETVIVEFPLPKTVPPEAAIGVMAQAVLDIGRRAARSAKLTIKPDVDEEELARRIDAGEVTLERGARKSKRRLNLKAETLIKNPPKTPASKK